MRVSRRRLSVGLLGLSVSLAGCSLISVETSRTGGSETVEYDSVEAAEDAVSFEVVEPVRLPDGFEMDRVTVSSTEELTAVAITYRRDSAAFVLSQLAGPGVSDEPPSGGEPVSVDGRDATFATGEEANVLYWNCDDITFSVAGPFTKDDLASVASRVPCE